MRSILLSSDSNLFMTDCMAGMEAGWASLKWTHERYRGYLLLHHLCTRTWRALRERSASAPVTVYTVVTRQRAAGARFIPWNLGHHRKCSSPRDGRERGLEGLLWESV